MMEGTGWAGNDANETSEVSTPHIRSLDGIHPFDIAFQDAVQNGITTVHVMPGSQNIICSVSVDTYGYFTT
ncbi:hypothetical protein ACUOFC_16095 [Escherichia sp. TWPC-MK]